MIPCTPQVRFRVRYAFTLLLLGLTLSGCEQKTPPANPSADTSPPGFLNVEIKLENRDGQPIQDTGGISIATSDVTRKISRLHKIRIIANASDAQSWITNLALATAQANDGQGVQKNYNLSWKCTGAILELAPLTTTPAIAMPGAQEFAALNVTVDPVGQASCSTGSLDGFIRVVATNGASQRTESKTFHFEFLP